MSKEQNKSAQANAEMLKAEETAEVQVAPEAQEAPKPPTLIEMLTVQRKIAEKSAQSLEGRIAALIAAERKGNAKG